MRMRRKFTVSIVVATLVFGVVPFVHAAPSEVRGTVFLDTNGNGKMDPGETRLSGVKVTLYRDDITNTIVTANSKAVSHKLTPLASSVTGSQGIFSFGAVGPHMVTIDEASLPRGTGLPINLPQPDGDLLFGVRQVAKVQTMDMNVEFGSASHLPVQLFDSAGDELRGPFEVSSKSAAIRYSNDAVKGHSMMNALAPVVVTAGNVSTEAAIRVTRPDVPSDQLIMMAQREGILSKDQQVLYLTYLLFDPSKLPQDYISLVKMRSATSALAEIMGSVGQLSPQTAQTVRGYLNKIVPATSSASPTSSVSATACQATLKGLCYDQSVQNQHFIVYYISNDPTNGSTAAYANHALQGFEAAYTVLGNQQYRMPAIPYKVYIDGSYGGGLTVPTGSGTSGDSYIEISNTFSDWYADATTSHELHHAAQFRYCYAKSGDTWFHEAAANWFQDEVFPNNNQYGDDIRTRWMPTPSASLDLANQSHEYGAAIFVKYLSGWYGGPLAVRKVFEGCSANPSAFMTTTVNNYLLTQGYTLDGVMNTFHTYNWWPTQYYADAGPANWGTPNLAAFGSLYPTSTTFGSNHLSSVYVQFQAPNTQSAYLRVLVKGGTAGSALYAARVQAQTPANWNDTFSIPLDSTSFGYLDIWNFGNTYDRMTLVATNKTWGPNQIDSTVSYKACYNQQCNW